MARIPTRSRRCTPLTLRRDDQWRTGWRLTHRFMEAARMRRLLTREEHYGVTCDQSVPALITCGLRLVGASSSVVARTISGHGSGYGKDARTVARISRGFTASARPIQRGPQLEHLRALRTGDVECGVQKLHGLACRAPHRTAHRRQAVDLSGEVSSECAFMRLGRPRELVLGGCTVSAKEHRLSQHRVETAAARPVPGYAMLEAIASCNSRARFRSCPSVPAPNRGRSGSVPASSTPESLAI